MITFHREVPDKNHIMIRKNGVSLGFISLKSASGSPLLVIAVPVNLEELEVITEEFKKYVKPI